jgi:hypothetical protein
MESAQRSVVGRVGGEGGMNRQRTENFKDSKTILCNTVMVGAYHSFHPKEQAIPE